MSHTRWGLALVLALLIATPLSAQTFGDITGTVTDSTGAVIPGATITVTDPQGEILIEHTRPSPGVGYVGNGLRRGPKTTEVLPMS